MVVKYTRNADDSARARISDRLRTREPVRAGFFSLGQGRGGGGMILSLGLVIVALMMFQGVVDRMQAAPAPGPERIETALGTIIGKAEADPEALGERPMLQLRLETLAGVVHEVWVPTDRESWEIAVEGEELEVEYAVREDGGSLRVQRLRVTSPDGLSPDGPAPE